MKTVKEVMTTDIQYCTPLDNMYEVAVKMKEYNVGAIPICEDGKLLGMITDRDIAIRGTAEKHPGSTKVTDIMSEELFTGTEDMSVDEAANLMAKKQIRRLPIVKGDKLVGVVSLGDLAIRKIFSDDAGRALSEISESHGEMHH